MTSNASFLLSQKGPFAAAFDRFIERPSQRSMAEAVEVALASRQTLLVEAGTGTGKTFAYLIPAIDFDGKTIISTGTRNLQDQLFSKDIPTVFRVLGKRRKVALLKGRQNYLCLYRLEVNIEGMQFINRDTMEQMVQIHHWSAKTTDGDLSQTTFLTDDAAALPLVTSTAENCLGTDCAYYNECFVARARKQAMEADIVVINHHLLMADLVLKEDGFGELLPRVDAYIVDEAHQLPEVASIFFGQNLSSRQLMELARDSVIAFHSDASDCKELKQAAESLEKQVADFRILLGDEVARQFWRLFRQQEAIAKAYEGLVSTLIELSEVLKTQVIRSRELENLYERSDELAIKAELFLSEDESEVVQWIEGYRKSFSLNTTPMNIAKSFQNAIKPHNNTAWIMTSATLAVNRQFHHFQQKLGLENVQQQVYPSPFDYSTQALLYVPRYLKNTASSDHTLNFIEQSLPLLKASKGRAFLLFTSHRALQQAAELLSQHREFTLFVQGQASKTFLLEQFKTTPNSVLLGTFSFWEGVDVAGDALSFVAIDKLPFASPGDPVNQARIRALKQQGKDAFHGFQLPDAIIALKQGAGRLIRGIHDKGVLMIADPRIVAREYGQKFLLDLPAMQLTRNQNLVLEFLENL
jgi:ATP-dependent DNA helicase DinG